MTPNQQRRQRATGYLFAFLAVVLAGSTAVALANGSPLRAAVTLLLVAFLGFLAWRQLQPNADEVQVTADERTRRTVRRASAQAFWLLFCVFFAQRSFEIIPPELLTNSYVLIGTIALGTFWAYDRFRGVPG